MPGRKKFEDGRLRRRKKLKHRRYSLTQKVLTSSSEGRLFPSCHNSPSLKIVPQGTLPLKPGLLAKRLSQRSGRPNLPL
jgi:hypothetical protein